MKLRAFAKKYRKQLVWVFVLVALCIVVHQFAIWQLDLICVRPVWEPGWCHPIGRYADDYFQCWLWKTTVGEAYDTLLFLNFISFFGLILVLGWFIYSLIKEM